MFVVHQNRERQADNDLVGTPQRLATTWTRPQPKCFIYCNLTQIPRLQIAFGAKVQQAAGSVSASASVLVLVLVLWLCPSVSSCVCVCLQQADQTRPDRIRWGAGNVNCSQFGSAFLGFFAASHCGRLMECFWHSNKMIIDHLIRNFRTMAPQTEDRERDRDQDQQDQQTDPRNVSLCACRVPPRQGQF